ncbi:MAG: sugar transferase [Bacteroidota bacterium]
MSGGASSPVRPWLDRLQRARDLGLVVPALVAGAPLGLALAAAVKLEDGGPVLFRQTRPGRHGRAFAILKFRSLGTQPHDAHRPDLAATRIGAWMRRWGLDELPQLWNVVRGEMSLVGPRPVLFGEIEHYNAEQRLRLAVRPGLTGWAQIHGRNALAWQDRTALDVWYVRHRSLWLDARILLRTPFALLRGEGVYGPGNEDVDDF